MLASFSAWCEMIDSSWRRSQKMTQHGSRPSCWQWHLMSTFMAMKRTLSTFFAYFLRWHARRPAHWMEEYSSIYWHAAVSLGSLLHVVVKFHSFIRYLINSTHYVLAGECWEKGNQAVKAASLAASSQCLRSFCIFLKEECGDILKATPMTNNLMGKGYAAAVYNEVIPIMQFLTSRMNELK